MARLTLRDRLVAGVVDMATAPVRRLSFSRSRTEPLTVRSGDGTRLHVDVYPPAAPGAGASRAGTVVLAHGYRDGSGQLAFLAKPLALRGYRVLAFDFRAHGRSEGERVTIGAREAGDVRAMLDAAREMEGGGPVLFMGYSMGASAYLVSLASGAEADRAVLDSPYDTLEGAFSARMQRFGFPESSARSLAAEGARHMGVELDSARPIDFVSGLTRPTLLVFARHDPWIGASTRAEFARRLPPSASMRVVLGGHKLHFGPRWRAAVLEFLAPPPLQSSQTA